MSTVHAAGYVDMFKTRFLIQGVLKDNRPRLRDLWRESDGQSWRRRFLLRRGRRYVSDYDGPLGRQRLLFHLLQPRQHSLLVRLPEIRQSLLIPKGCPSAEGPARPLVDLAVGEIPPIVPYLDDILS